MGCVTSLGATSDGPWAASEVTRDFLDPSLGWSGGESRCVKQRNDSCWSGGPLVEGFR
jgi:hypothetical protein